MLKNEQGFSLVEIIAGIVIISIILISAAQLIIQSNKTAEVNKNQLVVIHLSNAMLKRLKIETQFIKDSLPASKTWDECINIPLANGSTDFSTVTINGEKFNVSACLTPRKENDPEVKDDLNIYNVRVQVKDETEKRKSEIEGFVQL